MPEDQTNTAGPCRAAGAETSAPPASPPGYALLDQIGHGGMGVADHARGTALGREVAVKLLSERDPADSPVAPRFLSEARITGQLQHAGPGQPCPFPFPRVTTEQCQGSLTRSRTTTALPLRLDHEKASASE